MRQLKDWRNENDVMTALRTAVKLQREYFKDRLSFTQETSELFALPENIVPVAFLPIGYRTDNDAPAPGHEQRAALDEILLK